MKIEENSLSQQIRLALAHAAYGIPGAPDATVGALIFRWFAVGALLLLTSCAPSTVVPTRVVAPPVPSQCSAECTATCLPSEGKWPQWEGDPDDPSTWDLLPEQVIGPLRSIAETCDKHRQACVQCMGRLDRVGLTCGTTVACGSQP